jgi:hypothetical protein
VHAAALALQNFKTGLHSTLSFRAELVNLTTANGVVFLEPVGSDAAIVYLSFSVVVVAQDSSHLELLALSRADLAPGDTPTLKASSAKFDFDLHGGSPHYVHFFQWITGLSGYPNDTHINYESYSYLSLQPTELNLGYELELSFGTGPKIYMSGFKVGILLVSRVVGQGGTVYY